MIATVLIIMTALYWLMMETAWLRVSQPAGECYHHDIEYDYDGSDYVYLDDYDRQLQDAILDAEYDNAYKAWLDKRHAVKYTWRPKVQPAYADNPHDRWLHIEDDLRARRNGAMPYQQCDVRIYQ